MSVEQGERHAPDDDRHVDDIACARDARRRAGLADPADHAGGSIRGRRRHRRERAHPGAADGRAARPDHRGRECRRGGRHDRRPARRQGGARRLHLADRQHRHPRLQPDALQEAALQCRDRLPAGRAGVGIAAHPDRAQGPAGEQSAGVHRLREGEREQDAVRLGRRRLRHASALRAVQPGARSSTSRTCPIAAPAR